MNGPVLTVSSFDLRTVQSLATDYSMHAHNINVGSVLLMHRIGYDDFCLGQRFEPGSSIALKKHSDAKEK